MNEVQSAGDGLRISLLLPTPRDTLLTARLLAEAGIATRPCANVHELEAGDILDAGAVMVGEEWLAMGALDALSEAMSRQPAWSDLPILVVAQAGAESDHIGGLLQTLGNATLLDRPLRIAALTSAASAAIRARARQYQIRAQLEALEAAGRELATAARRKDEFLAMLGHELRNPLAPIRNALNLLRRLEGRSPSERDLLETMQRQTDHMVRLVEDLIDVARLTRGTIELRREPVALDEVLAAAMELSRPLVESAGHRIHFAANPPGLVIAADRVRLAQVFSNLLNNAAKYSEARGRIDVMIRAEAGEAVVDVVDQGMGIDADVLPFVFDMFVQGNRDASQVNDGLGIGLSLVRRLVELHGGSAIARSEGAGLGSLFQVRLPLVTPLHCIPTPERRASTPAAASAPAEYSPHLRVLVVDDNRDSAETLGMLLQTLGIDSEVVFSGEAALAAIETYRPTALFLDIGMPLMDGYEVARRIRALPGDRQIGLVALTGWSQASDQARTRAAGFDFHMSKPADFKELEHILGRLSAAAASTAQGSCPTP